MGTEQIDGLVQAIHEQCGMRATASKTWSDLGLSVRVQITLVPNADPHRDDDWQFFYAYTEAELPKLRDELVGFIAVNRKEVVA